MAVAELLHPTLVKDDPHTANPRAALVAYYRAAATELMAAGLPVNRPIGFGQGWSDTATGSVTGDLALRLAGVEL